MHDVFRLLDAFQGKNRRRRKCVRWSEKKIAEEIGLVVEVGKELGKNEYVASDPEKGKIKKSVTYFLALAKNDEIKLKNGWLGRCQMV